MYILNISQYLPFAALVVGLFLIAFAILNDDKKSHLKKDGIQAEGIVFQQDEGFNIANNYIADRRFNIKDNVQIRFVTKKEEWITGPIDQDFQIFFPLQYSNGDTVKLYYNPDNPAEFYVDSMQSSIGVRVLIGLAGLAMVLISLYKIFF